jgi:hypothetical protein
MSSPLNKNNYHSVCPQDEGQSVEHKWACSNFVWTHTFSVRSKASKNVSAVFTRVCIVRREHLYTVCQLSVRRPMQFVCA